MKSTRLLTLLLSVLVVGEPLVAAAQNSGTLFGSPVVDENSGLLKLSGQKIHLWGIDTLAPGQPCWRDNLEWACGNEARAALRQIVFNQAINCVVKQQIGNGHVAAQCFRQNAAQDDVARLIMLDGWAMDKLDISGGLYAIDQTTAQQARKGVWTSRFQTAEDWKQGVARYVSYKMEPLPAPAASQQVPVINNVTNIYPQKAIVILPGDRHDDPQHEPKPKTPPIKAQDNSASRANTGDVYEDLKERMRQQNLGTGDVYENLQERLAKQRSQQGSTDDHAQPKTSGDVSQTKEKPLQQTATPPAIMQ